MAFLKYVSDKNLIAEVQLLLERSIAQREFAEKNFNKNVIDPFSSLFEMPYFETHELWQASEIARQSQKTLQNHVGTFHQNLLGHVKGWENMKTGGVFDLKNSEMKIIAEIKNKYNTVTGSNLSKIYYSFDSLIADKHSGFKNYCAYFVNIIPQRPERHNIPFTPSDSSRGRRLPANENIRIIDGVSFYEIVTGRENALRELHTALPAVIEYVYKNALGLPNFAMADKEDFMQYFSLAYDKK